MDYARSSAQRSAASTKIVVAGGFGVGKTTLVGSVSEIQPLRTEALVTNESEGVDNLDAVPSKHTTTVAMDFGRITLAEDLVLYLFGTPGQRRFWFMWDDLCLGAIGAIVLVDTARLDEAFSPLDYFEAKGLPFIVCVNEFEGGQTAQSIFSFGASGISATSRLGFKCKSTLHQRLRRRVNGLIWSINFSWDSRCGRASD